MVLLGSGTQQGPLGCVCDREVPRQATMLTPQEVYALRARGMVRGGTIGAAIIGYGHDWYELDSVRFYSSEPARHKVVDLTVRGAGMFVSHAVRLGF